MVFDRLGNDGQRPSLLHNLGYVALHEHNFEQARQLFADALQGFFSAATAAV